MVISGRDRKAIAEMAEPNREARDRPPEKGRTRQQSTQRKEMTWLSEGSQLMALEEAAKELQKWDNQPRGTRDGGKREVPNKRRVNKARGWGKNQLNLGRKGNVLQKEKEKTGRNRKRNLCWRPDWQAPTTPGKTALGYGQPWGVGGDQMKETLYSTLAVVNPPKDDSNRRRIDNQPKAPERTTIREM